MDLFEEIVNDYYTANYKAEVVIDTLITPVLVDILNDSLVGEFEYITKEFPILKDEDDDFRSFKADYLVRNNKEKDNKNKFYFIELKTSNSSLDSNQLNRYINVLTSGETFGNYYKKFCNVIKNVYNKENIDDIYRLIEASDKGSSAELAKDYLKKKKYLGSKKYLFQLGQIMDKNCDSLSGSEVGLIYIVPNKELFLNRIDNSENEELKKNIKKIGDNFKIIGLNEVAEIETENEYYKSVIEIMKELYEDGEKNGKN